MDVGASNFDSWGMTGVWVHVSSVGGGGCRGKNNRQGTYVTDTDRDDKSKPSVEHRINQRWHPRGREAGILSV